MTKHFVEPEELQAFLDKELAPSRQAEVGRHVQDCQECSTMIADLQKVSATLQHWQVEPAPGNLKPPALPVEQRKASLSWTRLALTLSGATAVVLIIAAISIPNLLRSRMAGPTQHRVGDELSPLYAPPNDSVRGQGSGAVGKVESGPATTEESLRIMRKIESKIIGRLISYQVRMTVEVKEFEAAKIKLRETMDAEGGYITNSDFVETPNQPKRANLVLRVPAAKLATILNQIRELGRVKEEHLNSEEVTEQVVGLEARLKNARATEQRLVDVLNTRTGKVGDILQVEQEISRTREEIERMEAQRQNLMKRVEMATVTLTLAEEFKAELQPAPVGTLTQLWNALVDGWDNFSGSILGIMFFLARYGFSLILWGGLAWLTWRLARGRLLRLTGRPE